MCNARVGALGVFATATPALAGTPLPTGSYLQTCKVISFDHASGALQAYCEGPSQGLFSRPETPPFNVTGCQEGSIWNDARQLYCIAATPWGNDRVIPPGSYIDTCTDRKVIGGALLVAQCGTPSGDSRNASLDLRNCTWGRDIGNYAGSLDCERDLRTAIPERVFTGKTTGGVVRPVAVEPGLIKPVMIAPLAPAPGSTSEGKGDGKKKKDKKERGERG